MSFFVNGKKIKNKKVCDKIMKLLRNTEVIKGLSLYLLLSLVAISVAFSWEKKFGLFTGILCSCMILLHIGITYCRYRNIQKLSLEIDKTLHGEDHIFQRAYQEGELAFLESEIQKMTLRLREQKEQLLIDKKYLADSIADISHQIRTPLTSINLLVSFLADENITKEKQKRTTRELYERLSRIDWLITTLLKISKLDAGTIAFKKEKIPMWELIQKSVAPMLVPMELREQTLQIEVEGTFIGDVDWTCEAIGNIVKNCMEHTEIGGIITISAIENPIYTEIQISDNGCGIEEEDLPHIFERFYKGKHSSEKSFGIGLALARMIIMKQNGTIKAENRSTKGAEFTIRFYKKLTERK